MIVLLNRHHMAFICRDGDNNPIFFSVKLLATPAAIRSKKPIGHFLLGLHVLIMFWFIHFFIIVKSIRCLLWKVSFITLISFFRQNQTHIYSLTFLTKTSVYNSIFFSLLFLFSVPWLLLLEIRHLLFYKITRMIILHGIDIISLSGLGTIPS